MKIKTAAIIIIGFIIVFSRFDAPAIDTPHSASNNVSCGSCHGAALLNSPFWGGTMSYDQFCLNCHRASSGPYTDTNAPLVKTHSSSNTSNKYGEWTRECRNCHDPHYQRQKNYKTTDASNLYLATGTITSCVYNGNGTSTLTYSTSTITYKSGWNSTKLTAKTGDYRCTILFPNVNKLGYNYPVIAVDSIAKTITVSGNATTYLYPPTTFAATYGQYVKDIMDISADGSGANKTVKFFDRTGTKSYADGDGTYDGVCEACHTLTGHYRNNGGAPDQNHANLGGGGVAGTNCITCHPHLEGFKASCNVCHGFPPPALATGGVGPTGSATAGAHVLHATTKGYQCQLCHYNSFGSGTTHNDNKITLGFVNLPGGLTGGNYDGQTSANYEKSDLGTAVSKTGSKECSNLYCHGSTLAPDGGTDTTPVWDDPSTGACGTCHGATAANPPTRGSHLMHAGSANGGKQLECTACHSNYQTNHVNGGVNVQPGSGVNFTFPGDDTCSNISCHSNTDAGWGTSACLKCHSVSINNRAAITSQFNANSHHVQGVTLTGTHCYRCHWEANSDGTINGTYHGGSGASGSPVDLVIYGPGTRPATYNLGTTAIQFTANGTRAEIQKINSHCLGCHSTPNNAITPFADGKAPKQYAWDGTSVDAKYSQTGTTTWGKYTTTANAAKKDITKSYSAHGNAQNNYGGGWPDAPSGCFGVNITQTICTEFGGTWDGSCENISASACAQNFCAGLTSGACGTVGGTWTGTACTNISANACTGYCTLPREVCDYDEWEDWVCWTEYYIDANINQATCQSSGGTWTALNGTWKTGGKWGSGVDYALNATRGGVNARDVACFDCHNSHGSSASGTTTSYASATTNGGILKDTTAGKGGYSRTYKPASGGSSANKNAYNSGAGLCFDCHMTANDGTKPWGYQSTYGATQTVMGYGDTPYFGPGTSGPQQRFAYKSSTSHKGGHFGASSGLSSVPSKSINGLCTPCHDPHGVSPTLGSNIDHSVPLLKGTWLTSPYKEDAAPAVNGTGFSNDYYHIDQNTFGSDIIPPVAGIQETDTQFAGLCLNCHSKSSLTNGTTHTWKSKDRIHESVKGWKANGTIKHNYTCSKCHTPHNARLPRLMATNCLNSAHKGRMTYNPSPVISGSGSDCFRYEETGGPEYYCGSGSGRIPGSYSGVGSDAPPNHLVTCHGDNAADQSWNVKTAWAQEIPVITSGPSAGSFIAVGSDVQATITWTTNNSYSTSYVDYGLTSGYGLTTGNDSLVRTHSIVLHNLINHSTYHYRVRSRSGAGNETASGDYTFYISMPPTVPTLIHQANSICSPSCSVTLQWNASTDPDGGPLQYYVEVDDASNFSSPNYNSGWISGTSWAPALPTNTKWYWRVQARDANHTTAQDPVSGWSVSDSFSISDGSTPPQVTLSSPANGSSVLSDFAMQWNAVTSPFPEYQVQYSTDSTFNTGVVSSGWITSTAWTPHPGLGTYYWRVQARDSVSQVTGSWSSSWSVTIYDGCYGDSCCLYGCDTCPTLYAWDGTKYAFETDTFPTGYLGTKSASGGWRKPNPYEYHLLDSTPQLLGGYYNLKIVEERDETDYFDTLKLCTVDYPLNRDIYQELRTAGIYIEPAQMIHTVDKTLKRPLSITHVNTGENVSAKLAYSDKDYLILNIDKNIDFNWQTLEIDLGNQSLALQIKLIIDAETVVPTTSAGKARKNQLAPNGKITRLEVLDANGNWTLVPYTVKEVFSPKERSNAYIVDITNIFTASTYKFRLSFLYKVYVDAIFFDTTLDVPVTVTELPLVSATLGYYGFSQKTEGEIFDYIYGNIVSRDTSYFIGNYTKYGDVTPLLTQTDDKFVIFAGGEELNVLFTADSQPPAGKSRRYLVYANGYYKATGNIDISHTVEPLPFAAMSNYPYDPAYPTDAEHEQYLLEYNTREK